MDPNERSSEQQPQQPPPDLAPTTGTVASTGSLAPRDSHNNHTTASNASPFLSATRQSAQPSTPFAEGNTSTEYFPQLDVPPSLLQQIPSNTGTTRTRPHSSSNVSSSMGDAGNTLRRQPSIRLRRRSSSARSNRPGTVRNEVPARGARSQDTLAGGSNNAGDRSSFVGSSRSVSSTGRPRSISQPERAHIPQDPLLARHSRGVPQIVMPRLTEEGARPTMEELGAASRPPSPVHSLPERQLSLSRNQTGTGPPDGPQRLQRMRNMSRFFRPRRQSQQGAPQVAQQEPGEASAREASARAEEEYNERLVDYLDTIDPEVQTLSTLTNVQNSLFIPDLGKWVNRRPTYTLTEPDIEQELARPPPPPPQAAATKPTAEMPGEKRGEAAVEAGAVEERPRLERTSTITSHLSESHYAALPHGATLDGWTPEEKMELDDHVRHMLHSRRSKFKRSMKGFGQYVRRPLGFLVTLYATLITLFGLAWVLFLIGWIYVGDRQVYAIHVIDSILVALFAIMGDGLAPFRAIDTYHMAYVLHYARIVKKENKKKQHMPPISGQNAGLAAAVPATEPPRERDGTADLEREHSNDPHTMRNNIVDNDDTKSGIDAYEDTPLTFAQQKSLHHHQKKLAKSHSFYKPQETATHYAFPLNYLTAIVILLDCHSCLQISLGACTWGIDYHTRPFALTTVILCVSITCNISAGVIISIGDRKTRKKDVWKLMNRQELTSDAMKAIEQKRSHSHSNKENRTTESDLDTEQSKEATESNGLVKTLS